MIPIIILVFNVPTTLLLLCLLESDILGNLIRVKHPTPDLLQTVNWAKNPEFCWPGI